MPWAWFDVLPMVLLANEFVSGVVKLRFSTTEFQLADLCTKALPGERFQLILQQLGLECLMPVSLKSLWEEKEELQMRFKYPCKYFNTKKKIQKYKIFKKP